MSQYSDYIPSKDADLIDWADNFVATLEKYAVLWEIPKTEVTAIKNALAAFKPLHVKATGPEKSPMAVSLKKEGRAKLVGLVRQIADFRLKNPIITNPYRLELGLNKKTKTRTPVGVPSSYPGCAFKIQDYCQIRLQLWQETTGKGTIPHGYDGALLHCQIGGEPPADMDALPFKDMVTKTHYTIRFKPEEVGKKAYISLRWQTQKGLKGPWSPMQEIVVP